MSSATQMLRAHPGAADIDEELLAAAIDAATDCAQVCTACADACLAEKSVGDLVACIRTDLDCADICAVTARVLTRRTRPDDEVVRAVLRACIDACRACGGECAQHAEMHEHCRLCAEACGRCEEACRELAATLG
ncbi:four-helix bundle copper-binding protein [Gordonia hongkongensis]|uniref:Four-helix bundle copper-binding protein n=1 Tax=Gordonia hongkongensis TaxID=1701090 RepID=A0ABT6BXV6_9ACTN|nr:four-helix bundle copper-binding protein [Gordonia hongkongensis]MDF6102758.1 four-helix bundle copper-binding protein [Gordonia hongkongensis]